MDDFDYMYKFLVKTKDIGRVKIDSRDQELMEMLYFGRDKITVDDVEISEHIYNDLPTYMKYYDAKGSPPPPDEDGASKAPGGTHRGGIEPELTRTVDEM